MRAACPAHPEREAGATCSRCGTFGCASCLPAGALLCVSCMKRFDGEPLEAAIRWASRRVSILKLAIGLASTLVGVSLCLSFVLFVLGGLIGSGIGASLAAITIGMGRAMSALLLRVFTPRWINQARELFGLHDEVLQELRVVLR